MREILAQADGLLLWLEDQQDVRFGLWSGQNQQMSEQVKPRAKTGTVSQGSDLAMHGCSSSGRLEEQAVTHTCEAVLVPNAIRQRMLLNVDPATRAR